jgi:hypothetical protein
MTMALIILLFISTISILGLYRWLRARAQDETIASRLDLVKKYQWEKDLEKVKEKIRDGEF